MKFKVGQLVKSTFSMTGGTDGHINKGDTGIIVTVSPRPIDRLGPLYRVTWLTKQTVSDFWCRGDSLKPIEETQNGV
jgi:hypothetical protein